ncbi:MAG: ATP synthase F1 subunit delta [Aureliella sp.]|jgi:F-type H+-transporting ATPase subunit delta
MEQPAVNHPTVFDIEEQQVAALYSKALLNAAGDRVEQIVQELESVVKECLDRFPKLEFALGSPRISEDDKAAMLDRIFGGKVDATLLNFMKILSRRRRLGALRAIQKAATALRDEQLGRLAVLVTSSQKLTDEQKREITDKLKASFGKEVSLKEKVDPSLLGGIILRIGDRVYDGSVQGKMQVLRRAVAGGVERAIRDRYASLLS